MDDLEFDFERSLASQQRQKQASASSEQLYENAAGMRGTERPRNYRQVRGVSLWVHDARGAGIAGCSRSSGTHTQRHAHPQTHSPHFDAMQTVCTYWLRGLCMKGDSCGFLHQFDQSRMPVCRNLLKTGVCKDVDCPYKHSTEEIKECNMYKLGFCIYGPAVSWRGPVGVRVPTRLGKCLGLSRLPGFDVVSLLNDIV